MAATPKELPPQPCKNNKKNKQNEQYSTSSYFSDIVGIDGK